MQDSPELPAASLRMLRLGDQWHYQVTGTLTPPGGDPLDLTGYIEVSIAEDRLLARPGGMTILFAQKFQSTQPDGSKQDMPAPEWMFSFVQDANTRDLAITADNMLPGGACRAAKVPQVFYPGTWSSETRYDNRLDFDNGDSVHNTLSVIGQERIETKQGAFVCWKSTITSESPATGLIEGVDWWTPELGAPAQFSTSSKMPDGSRMRFVATLVRTNVQ